jgi:small multidrug resistance pump
MRAVLYAAAVYNVVWGSAAICFPACFFHWARMPLPRYPELWQCIGMFVAVYGVAYALAARDPLRLWPIVFVGLLGKILGPLGFAYAAFNGRLPWALGWTIVTNDLIWWIPFGAVLWRALRPKSGEDAANP